MLIYSKKFRSLRSLTAKMLQLVAQIFFARFARSVTAKKKITRNYWGKNVYFFSEL